MAELVSPVFADNPLEAIALTRELNPDLDPDEEFVRIALHIVREGKKFDPITFLKGFGKGDGVGYRLGNCWTIVIEASSGSPWVFLLWPKEIETELIFGFGRQIRRVAQTDGPNGTFFFKEDWRGLSEAAHGKPSVVCHTRIFRRFIEEADHEFGKPGVR